MVASPFLSIATIVIFIFYFATAFLRALGLHRKSMCFGNLTRFCEIPENLR